MIAQSPSYLSYKTGSDLLQTNHIWLTNESMVCHIGDDSTVVLEGDRDKTLVAGFHHSHGDFENILLLPHAAA